MTDDTVHQLGFLNYMKRIMAELAKREPRLQEALGHGGYNALPPNKTDWNLPEMGFQDIMKRWFEALEMIDETTTDPHSDSSYFPQDKPTHLGEWDHGYSPFAPPTDVGTSYAAKLRFTTDEVKKLRKDFLMIMKNLKRVKDYDMAWKLKEAMRTWRDRMDELIKQIRKDLEWQRKGDNNARWLLDNISPLWSFYLELNLPLENLGYARKYSPGTSKEDLFNKFKRDLPKWESRTRRYSREAWKYLNLLTEWADKQEKPLLIQTKDKENVSMEGFAVQLVAYDDTEDFHRKLLGEFKHGLKTYKARAKKVYPWLLRYQLPVVVDFEKGGDAAASYEYDHIKFTVWGMAWKNMPHVMAHEMGHHIYKTVLSSAMQNTWNNFVRGNYKKLDLRDVLKKGKPGEDLRNLGSRIEREDPILHLQLETLLHAPAYKELDLLTIRSIKEYLDDGGDPIVNVPAKPITGYSAKNTEEAFCETLGLLVGYGPRALLPEVRWMFKRLVPGVKFTGANKKQLSVKTDLFVPPYNQGFNPEPDKFSRRIYQLIALTPDGDLDAPDPARSYGEALRQAQGYKFRHVWIVQLSEPLTDTQVDLLEWKEDGRMRPEYVHNYLKNLGLTILYHSDPRHLKA